MATAPQTVFAQEIDAQIEGAKLCTRNLSRYERQYGIPMHLLSAISSTESGRYHKGLKITLPWPWTINVEGQGHYYDNKEQTIAAIRRFQLQGARSIDVGCMQVNLVHHPDAFANLDEALDPEHNVEYAARFLRGLYEENKSWKQASANYHSKTPERGTQYVGRVYDRWTNIIDRLRDAKLSIPESAVAALKEKELPAPPVQLTKLDPIPASKPSVTATKSNVVHVKPSTIRMNSITVSDSGASARDNGVLVIRPKVTVVDDAVAMVATVPVSQQVAQPMPTPQVIRVADTQALPPSGPRFIFDN